MNYCAKENCFCDFATERGYCHHSLCDHKITNGDTTQPTTTHAITLESVTVTNTNETITILATDPLFVPISENQLKPLPEPDLSQTIEGKVNEVKAELAKLGEILLEELQQLKQFIFEKWEVKE